MIYFLLLEKKLYETHILFKFSSNIASFNYPCILGKKLLKYRFCFINKIIFFNDFDKCNTIFLDAMNIAMQRLKEAIVWDS